MIWCWLSIHSMYTQGQYNHGFFSFHFSDGSNVSYAHTCVRCSVRLHELRTKQRMTVSAASKLLCNHLCRYRKLDLVMVRLKYCIPVIRTRQLSLHAMLCGVFRRRFLLGLTTESRLCITSIAKGNGWNTTTSQSVRLALIAILFLKVYTVTILTCVPGSGSSYAYGVLDQGYSRSMSRDEAIVLAKRAIYAASFRDYGTGGEVLGEIRNNPYKFIVYSWKTSCRFKKWNYPFCCSV